MTGTAQIMVRSRLPPCLELRQLFLEHLPPQLRRAVVVLQTQRAQVVDEVAPCVAERIRVSPGRQEAQTAFLADRLLAVVKAEPQMPSEGSPSFGQRGECRPYVLRLALLTPPEGGCRRPPILDDDERRTPRALDHLIEHPGEDTRISIVAKPRCMRVVGVGQEIAEFEWLDQIQPVASHKFV